MVTIRRANVDDLLKMQATNLLCLPENYSYKYYIYHYLSWTPLLFCAEDTDGKIVGYVLAKLEEEEEDSKTTTLGHITSISILRTHRRLGIATKLMKYALNMMKEFYNAKFCSLHVRAHNTPAFNMYNKVLGFEVMGIELGYYADKEDAYIMKYFFNEKDKEEVKDKILKISDQVQWKDICNHLEEVDANGEEKIDSDHKQKDDESGITNVDLKEEEKKKKKKKKNK